MKFEYIDNKFENLVKNIKNYFLDSTDMIHDARNKIKIINYENKIYIVKSFKIPHIVNKIVYTYFRDTKAKKSYKNAIKIGDFTPKSIGYIEFCKRGLLSNSYYISEKFDYDFTIREPLLDKDYEDRINIFKAFARFSFDLHENDILHNDFSPGNILVKKVANKYIFKIVDINRMDFFELDIQQRIKNFSQLWANDEDLKIIINEYSKLCKKDSTTLYELAQQYSQNHKRKKNFKKKLKGKKILD